MLSNSSALRSQGLLPLSPALQISVGIVVFNEEAHMTRLIHLLDQQYQRPHEIVVVDNGSTDRTLDALNALNALNSLRHGLSVPVKIFKSPTNNMGHARSIAVTNASGDFVAFLDADCSPSPSWLSELSTQFLKGSRVYGPRLAGVCGANRLPETSEFKVSVNQMLQSPLGHGYSPQAWLPTRRVPTDHLPTTNCLFLRDALLQTGNFSQSRTHAGEDVEMGRRLKRGGWTLLLCPSPVMVNDSAQNVREWSQRMQRFGKANRELMFHVPGFSHGPSLMVLISLTFAVLLFVTKAPWWTPGAFLGLYLSAIALECVRIERRSFKKQLRLARVLIVTHTSYFWGWLSFAPISLRICRPGQRARSACL